MDTQDIREQLRKILTEAHFNILETDVIDGQSLYSMRHIKYEIDKYFEKDETKRLMHLMEEYVEQRINEPSGGDSMPNGV